MPEWRDIPKQCECIMARNEGIGPVLQAETCPVEMPTGHDLLVRVHGVSVNPVDVKLFDSLQPDQHRRLGFDGAGVVVAVGEQVTDFQPGDEVFYAGDISRPGSFSQFQRVDSRLVAHKPESLTFAEAAAYPLVSLTAAESLFEHLRIPVSTPMEKRLLIINGGGGVGSMAIQLAKLAGVYVIATASRPESYEWCLQHGADEVIDHSRPLTEQIAEPVDWVLNAAPQIDDYMAQMAEVTRPFGRICALASARQPVNINVFKDRSQGFEWTFMFTRAKYGVAPERQGLWLRRIASWLKHGRLRSIMHYKWGRLDAHNLAYAFEQVREGHMTGKGVLEVSSG